MMRLELYPTVKTLKYLEDVCRPDKLAGSARSRGAGDLCEGLPPALRPADEGAEGFGYEAGHAPACEALSRAQGYALVISPEGIALKATDRAGLRYGLDTLGQIIAQAGADALPCLEIMDWPTLINRGLMLDVSRGKVYTRAWLLDLAALLARLRYNVLQLYVEHTFDFQSHPEIPQGSGALTAADILALQSRCEQLGIQLQANLQSLGHCRRILTRPEHLALAESDMLWSLSTTSEGSFQLLDELYAEYLPLFKSPWLNICLDEPYDIGRGQSAASGLDKGELYLRYVMRLHAVAGKYGKRLMMFGDFFLRHPELLARMPQDLIYLDWIYDPKAHYGTPAVYRQHGMTFWVCPGTGNWNTIFPRLDGAVTNVVNLTLEGVREGAQGMLLTDWNDHGGYTQPGPGFYLYTYAAMVAWTGADPGREAAGVWADRALALSGYAAAVLKIAEIYQIPPIWSKNRSQCVMALFDEPIFGGAVRGPVPPDALKAYDLSLPPGVEPVHGRHAQHPLRPYFSIPEAACLGIGVIVEQARPMAVRLAQGPVRDQLLYILDAFTLMLDKLALSRRIIARFEDGAPGVKDLIGFEEELRVIIARFVRLQMAYERNWFALARASEIEISLTYFAQIIARLDYLRDWLSLQRETLGKGLAADACFATYETAGYTTLPTY